MEDFLIKVDPIFLIGTIVFLGYFAILLFEKKRISQIISLILVGVVVGPVTGIIDTSPSSVIYEISPFLASLALILLLFDGGLNLNLVRTAKEFPKALLFTFVVFLLSTLTTGFLMERLFYWDFLSGILLGAILGGTSSAVIITIVEKSKISGNIKTFLTLESTITDVLVVISSSIILKFILEGNLNFNTAIVFLTSAFTTSIILGVVFAFVWIYLLNKLEDKSFFYMLTISFALVLYSSSNLLGGNGNFTVFIFALVLGNMKLISRYLNFEVFENLSFDKKIKHFQEEITFFIRTFFFVYMGLIIPIDTMLNPLILSVVFTLTIFYLLIRFLVVKVMLRDAKKDERFLVSTSLGRGLAAAVVASIAISYGLSIPGFVEIIIGVIIFTNIITTWGLYKHYHYVSYKEENNNKKSRDKKNKEMNPVYFIDWAF